MDSARNVVNPHKTKELVLRVVNARVVNVVEPLTLSHLSIF